MVLAITDEHCSLADSVRAVLTDRAALADARAALVGNGAALPAFWRDAQELGWFGLHVAEEYGGEGHTLAEAAVVLEQLGAAVAPGPALATMLASAFLQEAGSRELCANWLPGLARGDLQAAVAVGGECTLSDGVLSGSIVLLGSAQAALALVPVGADVAVVTDLAELTVTPIETLLDPSLPVSRATANRTRATTVLSGRSDLLERLGRLFAAAQAAGGMGRCLDAAVSYAKVREQFGRPIGSFQAVKHHCANMLLATELATAAVWDAARTKDDDEAGLTAAVAATMTLSPYVELAQLTIQLHGGVGYTWEHDAHLFLRRATALSALFGPSQAAARAVYALRRAGLARRASLELPPEAAHFRAQARAFAQTYRATPPERQQAVAARAGYTVPHWPTPYGRAAGPVEQIVIDEELRELPRQRLGLGEWVLPTILQHGTDEQRERLMWPSVEGRIRWCQLFSEPGAGSDAAAVTTKARPTEGGWLVTGQKVWTSDARNCQMGLATVRTDSAAAKHAGITAMIIELDAPGVEVRPLTELTGESLFNEVFLDEVFVPAANVVGEVNGGWRVARATLANERLSIGGHPVTLEADALLELVARHGPAGDAVVCEAGALLAEGQVLRALNMQQIERAIAGAEPGLEGNVGKTVGGEHAQRVVNLGMRIAGLAGVLGDEPQWQHDFLFARCLTIAGGTSEVIRTQIAERLLGLPREGAGAKGATS